MLKKSIKYVDYNGGEREEDFYFNLTEAELTRLNFTTEGGLEAVLNRIIATQDIPQLYQYFEKSDELLHRFTMCPAYNNLIMELIGDSDAAAAFVNAVIPQAPSSSAPVQSGVLPGRAPIEGVVTPR